MNLEEIKQSIENGIKVYWASEVYEVIKDNLGQYFVHCTLNDNYTGLTHSDGVTLSDKESKFSTNPADFDE